MFGEIHTLYPSSFPPLLREIHDPPKRLHARGDFDFTIPRKYLCVVGSRKYTSYGKEVCEMLISKLAGHSIVIVSGLARGIDEIAHEAALAAGLPTIAFPGSGLDEKTIYPKRNRRLAERIIEASGLLLSEYEHEMGAQNWMFPRRNRLMAGMSDAVLIVEATEKSGTLITASLATTYNRDVLAIPGSVFSRSSEGPHALIRDGAIPVTCGEDILHALGLDPNTKPLQTSLLETLPKDKREILELLHAPLAKDDLLRTLPIQTREANALITEMELEGLVKETSGVLRRC